MCDDDTTSRRSAQYRRTGSTWSCALPTSSPNRRGGWTDPAGDERRHRVTRRPISFRPMLDRFLPTAVLCGSSEQVSQARLLVAFCWILTALALLYGTIFWQMDSPAASASLLAGALVVLTSVFTFLHRGHPHVAGNILTAALYLTLTALGCRLGGHGAHALAWYTAVPVVALMLVGLRSALFWSLAAAGSLVAYYCLHVCEVAIPNDLNPAQYQLLGLISWIGLLALTLCLALIYQSSKDRIIQTLSESQQQYRAVVEDTSLLMCSFLPDTTLTFVNAAYCDYFGQTSDALIGHPFLALVPEEERPVVQAMLAAEAGAARVCEHWVERPDGTRRLLRWTNRAILRANGRASSYHSIGEDITEHVRADAEVRLSRDRARRQRNAIAALAVDESIARGDLATAVQTLTRTAADTLRVERASVWLFSSDKTEMRCTALFEASRGRHSGGAVLKTAESPRYLEALAIDSRINASDARNDQRTSEFAGGYLLPLGITSLLDAGITVHGELTGVVSLEHTGEPREWHSDEEAFVSTIASLVAQTLANGMRKVAEEEAARALALAEATLESIDNGILVIDQQRRIVKANSTFYRMWRVPDALANEQQDDQLLAFVLDQLSDPEQFVARINDLYERPQLESFDTLHFKDGRVFERVSRAMNVADRGVARVWSFRDVTGLVVARDSAEHAHLELEQTIRLLEEETARANTLAQHAELANAAKSEFLANMSHEIRTPMTAILGFADILTGSLPLGESRDAAVTIKQNGDYLLGIINDILDLSKIEAGHTVVERELCSPWQILQEVVSLMQVRSTAKNLALRVQCDGQIPETILSDPIRLRQILINLTGNAIKFTEVGQVTLAVRLLRMPRSTPQLLFDVTDSGIGISAEQVTRLFKPFSQLDSSATRKHGGTGLGLAISKRLARELGGDIVVSSVPGQGSTFTVTIDPGPLDPTRMITHHAPKDVPGRAPPSEQTAAPVSLAGCRVLLAEDGLDNQRLIAFLLRKAGADVMIADNGQVAHDVAVAESDRGTPYDVILMDMQMPIMDGYEATSRLRAAGYDRPIIALTAHAMSSDRDRCLQAGCDDYATKPIDRTALIALIDHHRGVPAR